jgi:hypothetical protein
MAVILSQPARFLESPIAIARQSVTLQKKEVKNVAQG